MFEIAEEEILILTPDEIRRQERYQAASTDNGHIFTKPASPSLAIPKSATTTMVLSSYPSSYYQNPPAAKAPHVPLKIQSPDRPRHSGYRL